MTYPVSSEILEREFGIALDFEFFCDSYGKANTTINNSITYIDNEKYLDLLLKNENVSVVITNSFFFKQD